MAKLVSRFSIAGSEDDFLTDLIDPNDPAYSNRIIRQMQTDLDDYFNADIEEMLDCDDEEHPQDAAL